MRIPSYTSNNYRKMLIIISITLQSQLTALMLAAMGGHTAVVNKLLTRQDLNINMTDKVQSVQKTLHFLHPI